MIDKKEKPSVAFVISTLSGGTPATNFDLMGGLSDLFRTFLFVSDGLRLRLYEAIEGRVQPVHEHTLANAIDPTTHVSAEYDATARRWLESQNIRLLHIRHLAWHSLNLPRTAASLGIPVIFSFHDYYMVCPNVKLFDNSQSFCSGRCTGGGNCTQELWPPAGFPHLKGAFVHKWRHACAEAISDCDVVITTCEAAAEIFDQHFGFLNKPVSIIPHGRDFVELAWSAKSNFAEAPLKIVLSNLNSVAKGADYLGRVVSELDPEKFEFHILGPAPSISAKNVRLYGEYRRAGAVNMIKEINADLGFITSLWPETYCHVLTEMWASGIPVLGVGMGAVAERLEQHGGGWLLESGDVGLAADALNYLKAHPDEISTQREVVRRIQEHHLKENTIPVMAGSYARVYQELMSSSSRLGSGSGTD